MKKPFLMSKVVTMIFIRIFTTFFRTPSIYVTVAITMPLCQNQHFPSEFRCVGAILEPVADARFFSP